MSKQNSAPHSTTELPFMVTVLSDVETPASLFHKLCSDEPTAFLFESAEGDTRLARYSLLGMDPVLTVTFQNGTATVTRTETKATTEFCFDNPLKVLETLLAQERQGFRATLPADFPFAGGFVGYLGSAATQYFDRIPQPETSPFGIPEGFYGLYDTFIVFDHLYRKIKFISYRSQSHLDRLLEKLTSTPHSLRPLIAPQPPITEPDLFEGVHTVFDREQFCTVVRKCKTLISAGEVFQIVPSQRFFVPIESQPFDIYRNLISLNPSPYAYFLKFPGFTYLGSSPETFVECRQGKVVLRALAGTRPRGTTPEADEALAQELQSNEKELAEHYMLIDLERNDLGRVCEVGSVAVGEIAQIIRYSHVMHLATEVSGTLRADKTVFDVFQSCFPRGTVSGAPKIRAMQLLAQLEPEQRGIYSGVVGYIDFNGNADGAIAIRSALVKDGVAHLNAGAGVVYDSDPEAEYEETRNKARSVLRAIVSTRHS